MRQASRVPLVRLLIACAALFAEHPGDDGHPHGGSQSGETRRRLAGEPGGGAELPAALESPQ